MTEKTYDPQYETNIPHFNKNVAIEWVKEHNNDKIKHWLENGRPHKRIVTEALYYCGYSNNLEALKLIYESNWLKKVNVLNIALDSYSECESGDEDEQYEWIVDKIFNEKDKSIKSKRKSFIYMLYKTAIGKNIAIKEGVDFKIKEAIEDLKKILDVANFDYHQYRLHKNEEKIEHAKKYLLESLDYINNGTPIHVPYLIELLKYSEKDDVKNFLNKIVSAEKIYFTEDLVSALFLTELQLWKRFNHIDSETLLGLVKLFKRSGVKEIIQITDKDLNSNRTIYDYLQDRRYRIGSVNIVGVEYNKRHKEIDIVKDKNGDLAPMSLNIDVRDYVFVEQTGENREKMVSQAEKEASKEKYDSL